MSLTTTLTTRPDNAIETDLATSTDEQADRQQALRNARRDHDINHQTTNRVTFRRLVAAEWLKFRSVRGNVYAVIATLASTTGLGVLFSWLIGRDTDDGPVGALSVALAGVDMSQLIIAIMGVALVAVEYQTGLIRSWFTAAPNRRSVLFAKVAVYASIAALTIAVAGAAALLLGQPLLPASIPAVGLFEGATLQALGGMAFYAAAIATMGLGLGFLLRSTAAGAGVAVATLFIAPIMTQLIPGSIGEWVTKVLPSNAANALSGTSGFGAENLLSPTMGLVVLLGWVAAVIVPATISLNRRDA